MFKPLAQTTKTRKFKTLDPRLDVDVTRKREPFQVPTSGYLKEYATIFIFHLPFCIQVPPSVFEIESKVRTSQASNLICKCRYIRKPI